MTARFRLSKAARRDLVEIGRYTFERWGEDQCRRYLTLLDARFRSLGKTPDQGRACDEIKPGYWLCREGRHVIFYKLAAHKQVEIIRVLHDRMLARRHL